jgi:hypothetical protein
MVRFHLRFDNRFDSRWDSYYSMLPGVVTEIGRPGSSMRGDDKGASLSTPSSNDCARGSSPLGPHLLDQRGWWEVALDAVSLSGIDSDPGWG